MVCFWFCLFIIFVFREAELIFCHPYHLFRVGGVEYYMCCIS